MMIRRCAVLSLMLAVMAAPVMADRLKDLARIKGVRNNQLVGYGLVVGLDGTGDKAPFTNQTFRNMMNQFGITLPEGVNPNLANVAAVTVSANLPPFAKAGQEIDITVSSIGNSDSLRGGTLLMAPLKGADGNVYAMAQGSLVVGGFGAEGRDGSRITVNVPSVGRIPNGATIEREIASPFARGDTITFHLMRPDFTTARRVVEVVNEYLGPEMAYAHDATSISVRAPRDPSQRVSFLSILENLEVARQFESIFLSEMLKSMRKAGDVLAEGNYLNSSQSEFYRDMFDSQMSLTMAGGQGTGLADALVRQLGKDIPGINKEGAPLASQKTSLADYCLLYTSPSP